MVERVLGWAQLWSISSYIPCIMFCCTDTQHTPHYLVLSCLAMDHYESWSKLKENIWKIDFHHFKTKYFYIGIRNQTFDSEQLMTCIILKENSDPPRLLDRQTDRQLWINETLLSCFVFVQFRWNYLQVVVLLNNAEVLPSWD